MSQLPLVTIVGVPNTGKSTLVNRLLGERRALVHSQPGMTRDIFRKKCVCDDIPMYLQDSGGFFLRDDWLTPEINRRIFQQARQSAVILFLFDGKREMLGYEKDLFLEIRKINKNIIPVINKVDNPNKYLIPSSYYELKNDYIQISAEHDLGIELLLEELSKYLKVAIPGPQKTEDTPLRISIVGKPNVGKSSLINRILNVEWAIVSPFPGTTRDSIDLEVIRNKQHFILVDNAGIRKLSKVKEETEGAAILRAERDIRSADIVIFLLDISSKIDQNDLLIADYILKSAKPVVVAINKCDLMTGNDEFQKNIKEIKRRLNFFYFAPFYSISAKSGKNIFKIIDKAGDIQRDLRNRIKPSVLIDMFHNIIKERRLMTMGNKVFNPKFITHESTQPFFIRFHSKENIRLRAADELYLKKRFFQELKISGIPIFFKTSSHS